MQSLLQLLHAVELLQVKELRLQRPKEALHRGIVQAVALAGHALRQSLLRQLPAIRRHPVVPSLIRVQQRLVRPAEPGQRLLQHRADQRKVRAPVHLVRHDLAVEQIHDPLLMGTGSGELTVQQVGRRGVQIPTIGLVLPGSYPGPQSHHLHQPLHRLGVDELPFVPQGQRDAPITVAPVMLLEDRLDALLQEYVFVRALLSRHLIIKRAAR